MGVGIWSTALPLQSADGERTTSIGNIFLPLLSSAYHSLCLILVHTLALFIVLNLILVHTPSSIRQRSMVTFRRPADLVPACAWVSKECQDMISRVPICNGTVRVCYHFNTSVDSYFHWFSPFCSRSHRNIFRYCNGRRLGMQCI